MEQNRIVRCFVCCEDEQEVWMLWREEWICRACVLSRLTCEPTYKIELTLVQDSEYYNSDDDYGEVDYD